MVGPTELIPKSRFRRLDGYSKTRLQSQMRTWKFHHRYLEGDMPLEATEKVEGALNVDDELSLLKKEHSVLDEKILALEEIRFPSPEEQQQIKRLKKEKLAIKTQLETMEKS